MKQRQAFPSESCLTADPCTKLQIHEHLLRFGLFSRRSDQTQLLVAWCGVSLPGLHGFFSPWSTDVTLVCWFPHCLTSYTDSDGPGHFPAWGLISSPQRIPESVPSCSQSSSQQPVLELPESVLLRRTPALPNVKVHAAPRAETQGVSLLRTHSCHPERLVSECCQAPGTVDRIGKHPYLVLPEVSPSVITTDSTSLPTAHSQTHAFVVAGQGVPRRHFLPSCPCVGYSRSETHSG